jgi:capsular exopolysaccharide synthesis family protein
MADQSALTVPGQNASQITQGGQWQGGGDDGRPAPVKNSLERPLAAIRRYKWLMVAIVAVAIGAGLVAMRFVTPEFEVRATIWIQSETPQDNQDRVGPIRSGQLLSESAWVELLRSSRIADAVVRKLALYVEPEKRADDSLFRGFVVSDSFAPGRYVLEVDVGKDAWRLLLSTGPQVERGVRGDSIGRKLGFRWMLPGAAFDREENSRIAFTVLTPREKATELLDKLGTKLVDRSNFLWLSFRDPDAARAAQILNTWTAEYVKVAEDLKKQNVVEFSKILEGQLLYAQTALHDAERTLENFRVHTITLPSESGPVSAGVEATRDPALKSFFEQKVEYDNIRRDREALERTLEGAINGRVPFETLLQIPSVNAGSGAEALREAFKRLFAVNADLSVKQQVYTAEMKVVRDLVDQRDQLRTSTIPGLARELLAQLRERESDFQTRIAGASKELQGVPPRTIEEMRLRRAVIVSEGLYTTLKTRYAEAKLAEASAAPDVRVLDPAVAPLKPTKNTKPMIMLFAVAAGLATAIGLAIMLDLVDKRFRYPEQATHELGLSVAGAVPRLPKGGVNPNSPEQIVQVVESFRSLRMHVMNTARGTPTTVAVSSAAPGDGKSLISANLAISFAEAGIKTLLVDGDTRRGALHQMFGVGNTPGLTDYLAGNAKVGDAVRQTNNDNLFVLPCGRRDPRSPEWLTSLRLPTLIAELRPRFEAIIIDTPPFAAGVDAYAISAAAGNLLMVVRVGHTERKLAAAKLAVADRLPIHMIGTVLNGVHLKGEFQYYSYSPGYGVGADESRVGALATTSAAE